MDTLLDETDDKMHTAVDNLTEMAEMTVIHASSTTREWLHTTVQLRMPPAIALCLRGMPGFCDQHGLRP
jgi:hypothetical protein